MGKIKHLECLYRTGGEVPDVNGTDAVCQRVEAKPSAVCLLA